MTPDDYREAMGHEETRDDEGVLEEMLAAYIDRLNRGEMLDEEMVLAEQPEIRYPNQTFSVFGQNDRVGPEMSCVTRFGSPPGPEVTTDLTEASSLMQFSRSMVEPGWSSRGSTRRRQWRRKGSLLRRRN